MRRTKGDQAQVKGMEPHPDKAAVNVNQIKPEQRKDGKDERVPEARPGRPAPVEGETRPRRQPSERDEEQDKKAPMGRRDNEQPKVAREGARADPEGPAPPSQGI